MELKHKLKFAKTTYVVITKLISSSEQVQTF